MSAAAEVIGTATILAGCVFYVAGTVGLLRFPDVFARLHALTKADNVGLMLVCAGLAVLDPAPRTVFLLALIWLMALLAAAVSAHLIARHARREPSDGSGAS